MKEMTSKLYIWFTILVFQGVLIWSKRKQLIKFNVDIIECVIVFEISITIHSVYISSNISAFIIYMKH